MFINITWSLCKEGYTQGENDLLINEIVLPKFSWCMAFQFTRLALQSFLTRCHKRRYVSVSYNVNNLLEKSDHHLFFELKHCDHPLNNLLPWYKDSSEQLRNRSVVTES